MMTTVVVARGQAQLAVPCQPGSVAMASSRLEMRQAAA